MAFIYFTVEETAIITGYSEYMIREFCKSKRLLSRKEGKFWLIPAREIAKEVDIRSTEFLEFAIKKLGTIKT